MLPITMKTAFSTWVLQKNTGEKKVPARLDLKDKQIVNESEFKDNFKEILFLHQADEYFSQSFFP